LRSAKFGGHISGELRAVRMARDNSHAGIPARERGFIGMYACLRTAREDLAHPLQRLRNIPG
jgi:hypothetical protein